MERLNFPSKNTVYAMSKVLFHSYDLFCFQDPYFREMQVPNPIILKRLNGLMGYFLWNWTEVNEQYRIVLDPRTTQLVWHRSLRIAFIPIRSTEQAVLRDDPFATASSIN